MLGASHGSALNLYKVYQEVTEHYSDHVNRYRDLLPNPFPLTGSILAAETHHQGLASRRS